MKKTDLRSSLAIDKSERVYVIDPMHSSRVHVFDRQGKFLYGIHSKKDSLYSIENPSGIAVDNNNLIYISCLNKEKEFIVKVFRYENNKK